MNPLTATILQRRHKYVLYALDIPELLGHMEGNATWGKGGSSGARRRCSLKHDGLWFQLYIS